MAQPQADCGAQVALQGRPGSLRGVTSGHGGWATTSIRGPRPPRVHVGDLPSDAAGGGDAPQAASTLSPQLQPALAVGEFMHSGSAVGARSAEGRQRRASCISEVVPRARSLADMLEQRRAQAATGSSNKLHPLNTPSQPSVDFLLSTPVDGKGGGVALLVPGLLVACAAVSGVAVAALDTPVAVGVVVLVYVVLAVSHVLWHMRARRAILEELRRQDPVKSPHWATETAHIFSPVAAPLPFDADIRSSYLLNGRLPAFTPTPTTSASVSQGTAMGSHSTGASRTAGTMSTVGAGLWDEAMQRGGATPSGFTPMASSTTAAGYSLGLKVSSRLDRIIQLLELVKVTVPPYATRCLGAVVKALRDPEAFTQPVLVGLPDGLQGPNHFGWAAQGMLAGSMRQQPTPVTSPAGMSTHSAAVSVHSSFDLAPVSRPHVGAGPTRPVLAWMPSGDQLPGATPQPIVTRVHGSALSLWSARRPVSRMSSCGSGTTTVAGLTVAVLSPTSTDTRSRQAARSSSNHTANQSSRVLSPESQSGATADGRGRFHTDKSDTMTPTGNTDAPREAADLSMESLLGAVASQLGWLPDLSDCDSVDMLAIGAMTPRPLVLVMVQVFGEADVLDSIGVSDATNVPFIARVNDGYCSSNKYHNAAHAANVVWAAQHWLRSTEPLQDVTPLQHYSTLIAAAIHDYKHPGVNNSFLVTTTHPIAITHNDSSVLERYHVAEAFGLAMGMGMQSPFTGLTAEAFDEMRALVIALVLATDTSTHFRFLAAVCSRKRTIVQNGVMGADSDEPVACMTDALKAVMMLSDIGHASAAFSVHQRWSECVREEFFSQGDAEFDLGIAVSPLCDRNSRVSLAVSQAGFFDFVAFPLFRGAKNLFPKQVQGHLRRLVSNKRQWARLAVSEKRRNCGVTGDSTAAQNHRRGSVEPGSPKSPLGGSAHVDSAASGLENGDPGAHVRVEVQPSEAMRTQTAAMSRRSSVDSRSPHRVGAAVTPRRQLAQSNSAGRPAGPAVPKGPSGAPRPPVVDANRVRARVAFSQTRPVSVTMEAVHMDFHPSAGEATPTLYAKGSPSRSQGTGASPVAGATPSLAAAAGRQHTSASDVGAGTGQSGSGTGIRSSCQPGDAAAGPARDTGSGVEVSAADGGDTTRQASVELSGFNV